MEGNRPHLLKYLFHFAVVVDGALICLGLGGCQVDGYGFAGAFEGPLVVRAVGFLFFWRFGVGACYGALGDGAL